MVSLRDLKQRIKSVSGIRQITRAMEMVSATKLRRAQQRIESARPYTEKMDEILAHLAEAIEPGVVFHPLMKPREEVKNLLLIGVASGKGLCGSFNANIVRKIESHSRQAKADGIDIVLLLIGKKLHDYFKRRKWIIHPNSLKYFSIDESLPIPLLQEIMDLCSDGYLSKEFDKVEIIYTEFKSAIVHKIVERQFLPIIGLQSDSNSDRSRTREYIFEPDPGELFTILIPKYARVVLFKMLADSLASEHGGRMSAMHNATDNAGDMIRTLTLHRNKARQAAITKELSEIVAGAEALVG
jgi:F-type H+-transporting ATPase subunit gamma